MNNKVIRKSQLVKFDLQEVLRIIREDGEMQGYIMEVFNHFYDKIGGLKQVKSIPHFPRCNKGDWDRICRAMMDRDKLDNGKRPYDKQVFPGGAWLNYGFSVTSWIKSGYVLIDMTDAEYEPGHGPLTTEEKMAIQTINSRIRAHWIGRANDAELGETPNSIEADTAMLDSVLVDMLRQIYPADFFKDDLSNFYRRVTSHLPWKSLDKDFPYLARQMDGFKNSEGQSYEDYCRGCAIAQHNGIRMR